MAFLSFNNYPTPLTWLRVTFVCSPIKNNKKKGRDLKNIDAIKKNSSSTLNTIPKDFQKIFSSSSRTAGSSVSAHKESILNTIKYF
jgi:hypothetical protein